MDVVSLKLSSFAYLLAAAGYIANVLRPGELARRSGPVLLILAFVLHSSFLFARTFGTGVLPATTFAGGLAFFAWLVVGIYLLVQARYSLSGVGAVVGPIAFALTLAAASLAPVQRALPDTLYGPGLAIHVSLAFLGNAVFALAFALSCVYLLQERLLKSRSHGEMIRRLPSLGRLDRLNHVLLAVGFPLLTLGIVSGGLWSAAYTGRFWSWEPREILSIITWVLYAGLIQFRLAGGLRGSRAARLTIFAFAVVLASYLAVNLLPLAGRHGGGLGA